MTADLTPATSRSVLAALLLLAASAPLQAHELAAGSAGGFLAGLSHPVLGPDHLLAMVAVGLWGAVLGRPLVFALPVVFPGLMLLGAALGMAGVPLPQVERGIALSVLALGLAIAAAWRAPMAAALALVAIFGVFHGHAHGMELPGSADPVAYACGFLLATGGLHLAGILVGSLWHRRSGAWLVRGAGAAIGVAGAAFLLLPVLAA
ncbi:HupE/UreJ family protein [Ramlibacter rhizophilus]|uniref:HupE/UreJ family protein n=1 Tax=Ramlibacter rhizophilus TaxID=1781167 RepID=A0A4Z0BPR1_9BURK|nr:HupE/UreJ family protein [Ramlibacter rhizophilus]TFZ01306.1 HupE/UreJ family protein [Ramlibacter rhizophilus]